MSDRYSNGKIYKLVNNVDDEIYVGSTCTPLAKRWYEHKKYAERFPERRVYKHFLRAIGLSNVRIILIEEYACSNRRQLGKRERFWFDQLQPSLNMQVPSRSREEYEQSEACKISNRKKHAKYQQTSPVYKAYVERKKQEAREKTREKNLMKRITAFLDAHKIQKGKN